MTHVHDAVVKLLATAWNVVNGCQISPSAMLCHRTDTPEGCHLTSMGQASMPRLPEPMKGAVYGSGLPAHPARRPDSGQKVHLPDIHLHRLT